jgi:uncharacterized repeat protein (TIGR03806 family)
MNPPAMHLKVASIGILALTSFLTGGLSAQSGLDQAQPFTAFLNGKFPSTTPGSTPGGSWTTQNAFPGLGFPEPVRIVEPPRENKLVVVSKTGPIWIFNNSSSATTKQLLLDLTSKTNYPEVGEGGVSGFAFHPDFGKAGSPNRGYIYVAYRFAPGLTGIQLPEQAGFNRISRFTVADGSSTASISSELVLINQYDRQQWHVGGDMFFGSDSFLYIGVGDEGNAFARSDATQRTNGGLWSGILRIDVNNNPQLSVPITRQPLDASQINSAASSQTNPRPPSWPASFTQGYSIPLDNPFRTAGSLGEFYAIGMRHPVTGHIWYADVGEDQREEIGRVVKGGNHQWGFKEGLDFSGPITQPSTLIGISTPPVLDYSHGIGKAVIGAGVYRGSQFPELQGKYIFSDFSNGQLWAINSSEKGPIAVRNQSPLPAGIQFLTQLPAGFSAGINSFSLTRDGSVLMAKSAGGAKNGGVILGLVRQGTPTPQPPALLSQTGAFLNLSSLSVSSGFLPYSLVVPFWSDNALKSRWVGIPNNGTHDTAAERVTTTADGDWNLPIGSVTIKHFEMVLDQRTPAVTKRLETRFMIHANDGWYGVSYRWNAAGTDADLIYDSQLQSLQITDTTGKATPQKWTYPSRTQCMTCHNPVAGGSLGLMNRQLNKDHFYVTTGRTANQLATFSSLGILQPPVITADLSNITTLKATADNSATLAQRARSYLDSNCAYCHQPGGVRASFDARYTTPLENAGMLNGSLAESLGISGAAVVSPGNLAKSILHHRANSVGEGHSMPPIGKDTVDTAGVAVLADWIYSLAPANGNGGASLGNNTSTGGDFSDAHHPSLFVNKTDSFTNNGSGPVIVSLANFSFHATKQGNPLTPFVAIVSGTDSFTVAAIGTTRPGGTYQTGQNQFLFSNGDGKSFTLAPGAKIVTGFMDCLPDGSGWGGGSVIPATTSGGNSEDDVWALLPDPLVTQNTPYNGALATPSIVTGQTIAASNAGKALKIYPSLRRSYKFSISYNIAAPASPGGGVELLTNGSFELSNPKPLTWLRVNKTDIPGWDTSSSANLIEIWKSGFLGFPAVAGGQLVEMDANTLEQTFATVPASTLFWSFHHRGRDGNDTVALDIGAPGSPARVKTATTGKNAWFKHEGSYLVPPGQTLTRITLVPISGASSLIAANLIDAISVKQVLPDSDGDGVPDYFDAFPNDSNESVDTDGDGIGDHSDPFPLDPLNGSGSGGSSGFQLIVNGSFETTSPLVSTYLKMDKSAVTGWNTDSPESLIEVWKSGFFNAPAQDGIQLVEMDGNSLEQILATTPGATLTWSFHHRGRDGNDTVALDLGNTSNPARVNTFTTGKNAWLEYEGNYIVPAGQTLTKFRLVAISGANGVGPLTSANFIDNVSVLQNTPQVPVDSDGDGVPDSQDAFPNDPDETVDTDDDGTGDNADAFPNNPSETSDSDGDGTGDNADQFPNDPDETIDTDGDGIGDNSDPFPNDPENGGQPVVTELIVNGSFEQTNPLASTWLLLDKSAVVGWDTNALTDTIEIWKSGFFNVPAQDGTQLAEMDGNTLEQTLPTVPGSTLNWSLHHRGRDGFDTGALDIGPPGNLQRVSIFATGNTAWLKQEGSYLVPPGQTLTKFSIVPISAASALTSANFIDNVSVIQSTPHTTPVDRDGDGVPDHLDEFPDDPEESVDSDNDGVGDNSDVFPDDPAESSDRDGDGIGDNSDPYPDDPDNGEVDVPVVTELITNGSFEQTNPLVSTWLRIPTADVPGWASNSPASSLEIWKSGFLGAPSQNGGQHSEMDGNTLEQTLNTVPGATLTWSFYHRGRDGNDTVALDLGAPGNLNRVKTATTGKNGWVKYEGDYIVPAGQNRTRFVLVPLAGASSLIAANFIDNVSVIQTTSGPPPVGGNDGLSNGSFEQNLDGWSYSNVAIVTANTYSGSKALDLKSGFISQTITGLVPGDTYTLYLAYRSQAGVTGLLGDATVSINSTPIGEIHNASEDYLFKNGFQFVAPAAAVILRVQSQESGTTGLLIDALRIEHVPLPLPPSSSSLQNGSFEDQTGLSGVNPHTSGFELPGWLVTRENVDPILASAFSGWTAVNGNWVLDLSGHGPGGIAQTVTGFAPGSLHTLSFSYARHKYWDQEPILKAEVYANGQLVASLERNSSQKVPNWATLSLQIAASASGAITIEFRSTSKLVGGGIILDNVALSP